MGMSGKLELSIDPATDGYAAVCVYKNGRVQMVKHLPSNLHGEKFEAALERLLEQVRAHYHVEEERS